MSIFVTCFILSYLKFSALPGCCYQNLIEWVLVVSLSGTCKWTKLNIGEGPFPYIDITLQCILPFTTMLLLYLHMLYKVKKMPNLLQGRGAAISKRITILALAASCALVIGWLPSRVSFMLSKLNLNDANGLLHFWLVAFSFANSFVNPFLYGVYSSEFRRDYKALLSKLVCIKGMSISPSLNASTNKRKGSIRFSLSNADTFTIALDTDVWTQGCLKITFWMYIYEW